MEQCYFRCRCERVSGVVCCEHSLDAVLGGPSLKPEKQGIARDAIQRGERFVKQQ